MSILDQSHHLHMMLRARWLATGSDIDLQLYVEAGLLEDAIHRANLEELERKYYAEDN